MSESPQVRAAATGAMKSIFIREERSLSLFKVDQLPESYRSKPSRRFGRRLERRGRFVRSETL